MPALLPSRHDAVVESHHAAADTSHDVAQRRTTSHGTPRHRTARHRIGQRAASSSTCHPGPGRDVPQAGHAGHRNSSSGPTRGPVLQARVSGHGVERANNKPTSLAPGGQRASRLYAAIAPGGQCTSRRYALVASDGQVRSQSQPASNNPGVRPPCEARSSVRPGRNPLTERTNRNPGVRPPCESRSSVKPGRNPLSVVQPLRAGPTRGARANGMRTWKW